MTTTISNNHRTTARSEAAIYAHGTPFTADELFAQWLAECESSGKVANPQEVYEQVLCDHPDFEAGWLA